MDAFYERLGGGRFAATAATMSPWSKTLQHGGPPSALLGEEAQRACNVPQMRLARLTVEFLGPIPLGTVTVRSQTVRPGRQVRLIDAVMEHDGREIVLAHAWFILTAPEADPVLSALPRRFPPPEAIPAEQPQIYFQGLENWGYGEATEWRFIKGSFASEGPRYVWTRVRLPLIAGEPLDGLARVLIIADSANGLSRELSFRDWIFIPPSITVTLDRYPAGDWVAIDAVTQISPDGVGLSTATLFDERDRIGVAAQPLLITKR